MTTKIKPLSNKILVKRSKPVASKGGILLPETAQEKPKEGVVVAVGPGKYNDRGEIEQLNVKLNDRVLFSSYSGTEVKTEGNSSEDEYLILSEDDVLGILN